jgi:uncharacterized protein involved in exopolysaccharide biosynthesis
MNMNFKVLGMRQSLQFGIAGAVLTSLVLLFTPNYYRSVERILPVETKSIGNLSSLGNLSAAAAAIGVNLPGSDGSDANFVDILQSRWMADRLLQEQYSFSWRRFPFFGRAETRTETLAEFLHCKNEDRAVEKLKKYFSASRDLKSKIIMVTADAPSPELSQLIVLNAGKLLEEFVKGKGRTKGGAKALFAEARLKEARGEMDQAVENFRAFLEVNRTYRTSMDPTIQLRGQSLESELRLRQQLVVNLAVTREQALLEEKDDIPIVNILDRGNLPLEKQWPPRALLIFGVFVSLFGGLLVWFNRHQLLEFVKE